MNLKLLGKNVIPTALSCLRILLSPFFFLTFNSIRWLSIIIFAIAAATDFLDGYLARRFHCTSSFGEMIDPLADKIFLNTAGITMYFELNNAPYSFLCIVLFLLVRDLLLIIGAIYAIVRKKSIQISPIFISKICTTYILLLYIIIMIFNFSIPYINNMLFIGCILIIVTAMLYVIRFFTKK